MKSLSPQQVVCGIFGGFGTCSILQLWQVFFTGIFPICIFFLALHSPIETPLLIVPKLRTLQKLLVNRTLEIHGVFRSI